MCGLVLRAVSLPSVLFTVPLIVCPDPRVVTVCDCIVCCFCLLWLCYSVTILQSKLVRFYFLHIDMLFRAVQDLEASEFRIGKAIDKRLYIPPAVESVE